MDSDSAQIRRATRYFFRMGGSSARGLRCRFREGLRLFMNHVQRASGRLFSLAQFSSALCKGRFRRFATGNLLSNALFGFIIITFMALDVFGPVLYRRLKTCFFGGLDCLQ